MSVPLLLEWYQRLPEVHRGIDDPDFSSHRMRQALRKLSRRVKSRYREGTLQRLLGYDATEVRRASALALGLVGTYESNGCLARVLHDQDDLTARLAADSMWEIWFRGNSIDEARELQRILHLSILEQIWSALQALIARAPEYIEAYNQRAIIYFRREEYQRCVEDCERVLQKNPHHFGAQAGVAECYLKMNRPHAALQAFRLALAINPRLVHVREMVRSLEAALEET